MLLKRLTLIEFHRAFCVNAHPSCCLLSQDCLVLKTKVFPSSWKSSLVQPIPMNSDRSNQFNYKSISITYSLSKVFKVMLDNHFLKHLENNSLLSDTSMVFAKPGQLVIFWHLTGYGTSHCFLKLTSYLKFSTLYLTNFPINPTL